MLVFKSILLGQNLIQNSSFENYSSLSCNSAGFDDYTAIGTPHILDYWYGYFSPDYFRNACANNGVGVPFNYFGYCFPNSGNAYVGIGIYQKGNEQKEYIYQQLSSSLVAGKIYCLSFYISRSQRSTFAVKNIEAYFSSSIPNLTASQYINATPQIIKQSNFITDTTQWTQIQGCFTASGGEQYITIGNFDSNANTDTLFIGTNNPIPFYGDYSYYYIDDVTLIDQATVGLNELEKTNSIEIYPNPVNDILNITSEKIVDNSYLKIFNLLGELIYTERLNPHHSSLNVENLKNGIYFCNIVISDKIIKSDKIVIVK